MSMYRRRLGTARTQKDAVVRASAKFIASDELFADESPWVIEHSFPQHAIETTIVFDLPPEPRRVRFRRTDDEVRETFERLRSEWANAVGSSSSLDERFMNWAHQRIIGLGPQVLPLIIEDLRQSGGLWFWALTAIVGEDMAAGADTV